MLALGSCQGSSISLLSAKAEVSFAGISLKPVPDPGPAADRPVHAQALDTVRRQPVRADLRANVPVLAPGDFDSRPHHGSADGASAAVHVLIPSPHRANIEKEPQAATALDSEPSATEIRARDAIAAKGISRGIPGEPMAVFPKKAQSAGAKQASFDSCLSAPRRRAAGDCKDSATNQPAEFYSLRESDRGGEKHQSEQLLFH